MRCICALFNLKLWWNYLLTPDHIELFKSETFPTIIHNVSFLSALWEFLIFEICSEWRSAEGFQFLVTELSWLSFGGNSWPCWKVLVWCLLLRSGVNIFVLRARNKFTQSFGFWFLISFLKCNLLRSEVFIFLFLIFCFLISFWYGIQSAFWWWFWCTVGLCPMTLRFMQ